MRGEALSPCGAAWHPSWKVFTRLVVVLQGEAVNAIAQARGICTVVSGSRFLWVTRNIILEMLFDEGLNKVLTLA